MRRQYPKFVALLVVVFLSAFAAFAQDQPSSSPGPGSAGSPGASDAPKNDLSFQISGIFTGDTNPSGSFASHFVTNSAGLLVNDRYHFTKWWAIEGNYGFTRNSHGYVTNLGPASVQANMHEVSGNLVFNTPSFFGLQPFVLGGGGGLDFRPTSSTTNVPGASAQWKAMWDYGAGLDFRIANVGLRFQVRELNYRPPNFNLPSLATTGWAHVTQPSAGIVFTF